MKKKKMNIFKRTLATLTSSLFTNWGSILVLFIVEIMLIVWLLMSISYAFVSKLHKKLK